MFKEFLDLGRHPVANAFLREEDFDDEFFFDLKVCWDDESKKNSSSKSSSLRNALATGCLPKSKNSLNIF
jgi:hypothetical protein